MYAWLITQDHVTDGDVSAVGAFGPSGATQAQQAELLSGQGRVFSLFDDDEILYYVGRLVCDPEDEGSEEVVFGPLDDFGAPFAGCTKVKWDGDDDFS